MSGSINTRQSKIMKKAAHDIIFITPCSLLRKAIKLKRIPSTKKIHPTRTTGSIISVVLQLTTNAPNPKTIKAIDHILKDLFK